MMTLNLHLVIAVLFTLYLGVNSNFRRMMNLFLIYMFFTVYEMYFSHTVTLKVVDSFLLLTSLMYKTLYFPLCAGIALVSSSKVSELICFLRQIRLPKKVIIVLAVFIQIFPSSLDRLQTYKKLIKN